MKRPFLVILILVILNIFLCLNFNLIYIFTFNILLFFLCILFKEKRLIPFIIFSLAFSLIISNYINKDINSYSGDIIIEGKVIEYGIGNEDKLILKTKALKKHNKNYSVKTKILLTYSGDISKLIGKNIVIKAKIELPDKNTNTRMFSYRNYLASKGIRYLGYLKIKNILKVSDNIFNYNKLIYNFRVNMEKQFEKIYQGKTLIFIKGFIYGDKSDFNEDQLEAFYNVGLGHILVVSGLHFGILYLILSKILNYFKIPMLKKIFLINIFLFFMLIITGFKISAIRAFIVIMISEYLYLINRRLDILNLLSFLALITIVINPFAIYSLSFILSFGAIFSIALFYNKISKKVPNTIRLIISVQIILIFISIYSFNRLNLSTFFINIPTNFIVSILYILILANFLLYKLKILTIVISKIIGFIFYMVDFFEKIDIFQFRIASFSIIQIITIIFIFFLIVYKKETDKIKNKYIIYFIIFSIVISNASVLLNQQIFIKFYDVKSGDSSLVITPHQSKVLIDTGRKDNYNLIGDILLKDGIKNIDILVLTHNHSDHIGGVKNLLESHKIKYLILSKDSEKNEEIKEILNKLDKSTKVVYLGYGDRIKIDELNFKVLNPSNFKYDNENNRSLVLDLKYNDKRILFTGDLEKEGEKNILNDIIENYDILKVAHHGSDTSSNQDFINKANPKYSVIQVGKNSYGHPSNIILKRLESRNSQIYRNDIYGCITFKLSNDINIDLVKTE